MLSSIDVLQRVRESQIKGARTYPNSAQDIDRSQIRMSRSFQLLQYAFRTEPEVVAKLSLDTLQCESDAIEH